MTEQEQNRDRAFIITLLDAINEYVERGFDIVNADTDEIAGVAARAVAIAEDLVDATKADYAEFFVDEDRPTWLETD